MASLVVLIWEIVTLIVGFGPVIWLTHHWDSQGYAARQRAARDGLPFPALDRGTLALRCGLALAVFAATGSVALYMQKATPAIWRALA